MRRREKRKQMKRKEGWKSKLGRWKIDKKKRKERRREKCSNEGDKSNGRK